MKSTLAIILSISTVAAFLCSYFLQLTMDNAEQYLAIIALVFTDGFLNQKEVNYVLDKIDKHKGIRK